MRRRIPFFAWSLALLLVGYFSLQLSMKTTWASVECIRDNGSAGVCNFTTRSLTWDVSRTLPADTIGGYFMEPQDLAYREHWRLWMDTSYGAVPVTSLHSDPQQVAVVADKIREFLSTPNQISFRFEEQMPWSVWEKSVLVFGLMLLLPIGIGIIQDVREVRPSAAPSMVSPAAS